MERFGDENTWELQKYPQSVLYFYKEALDKIEKSVKIQISEAKKD